jgi:antitoxin MazE
VKTRLRKIGNSVGILIPKPFLAELGLQAGDPVDIKVRKGRINIEPVKRKARADRAGASGQPAGQDREKPAPESADPASEESK